MIAYKPLEVRTIKRVTLGGAWQILKRARYDGGHEHVPDAHTTAKQQLDQVDAFIERQRARIGRP